MDEVGPSSSSAEQLERSISSSGNSNSTIRQSERSSENSSGYSMSTTSTRRTRHRVDAGEPRGCFTSTYANNPLPLPIQHQSSSLTLGNTSSRLTQSLDYFTPMKMLTDFSVINEQVNSSVHNNNNNNNTNINNNNNNNNNQQQQKLLLREMLQKSQLRNEQLRIKSGYEENIEIELNKIQNSGSKPPPSQQLLRANGCRKRKLYQPVRNQDSNSPAYLEHNSNGDVITTTTSGNGMVMTMTEQSSPEDLNVEALYNGGPGLKGLIPNENNEYPKKREVQEGDHHSSSLGNNLAKTHPNLHSNLLQTPPYLQQWKDTFKSALVNNISDLIDMQFNLLFSTNTPPTLNPNLPNLHNIQPPSQQQLHQQQQQQHSNSLPHEHNPHHLMNGGSNMSKNHPSPPSNRYPSRYNPLPVAPPPQPHFSSALLALSRNYKSVIGDGGGLRGGDRDSAMILGGSGNSDEYCEDSPLSLVMTPKKKRHKVTDTRLTPRAVSRLLDTPSFQNSSPPPNSTTLNNNNNNNNGTPSSTGNFIIQQPPSELATSVAITNPSLNESRHLFPTFNNTGPYNGIIRMMDSPPDYLSQQRASSVHTTGGSDSETGGSYDGNGLGGSSFGGHGLGGGSSSSTLTPMHLRKAKLMFFWVRYPSSAVLKMYFPDIKFNKNNTAQLVKWFSNFREFYYIQMEKYARTGLTEGVKNAEDLHVSCESELYRVLNLHYNRNNHIEVPTSFRYVVEQTLREFFKAIQSGKDSEQSWKKAIYKIIARLDDPVPDYFKSPNFLEQLE